jgi:hypothetical protein
MASEYDFISPYYRRPRRRTGVLAGLGAVLAGAAATALIVAVPLQPRSNSDVTFGAPVAGRAQDGVQPAAADAATTGDVGAARVAGRAPLPVAEAASKVAAPARAMLTSSGNTTLSRSALSYLRLAEAAPAASDPAPPAQPLTDAPVSQARPPSGAAAEPPRARLGAGRSRPEKPATTAARTRDNVPAEPQPVRPEPFSVQEFFASRGFQ